MKEKEFTFRKVLLLVATLSAIAITVYWWYHLLASGLRGSIIFYNAGALTVRAFLLVFVLPSTIGVAYIAGLIRLYRKRKPLSAFFIFASASLVGSIIYGPFIMYVDDLF